MLKIKVISVICTISLLLSFGILAEATDGSETYQIGAVINEIIAAKEQGGSAQAFADGFLSDNAGVLSEWYVIALSDEDIDFKEYEAALLSYLKNNTVTSASTKQKYALTLALIGSTDSYISYALESTIGSLGLMSYVFGLHILNNGYKLTDKTIDTVTSSILALELEGGGFAISANTPEADATAMVITALAPWYGSNSEVTDAVDRGISKLSELQTESGGFISYGEENAESISQVIIALTSLGIDPFSDERFSKGEGLYNALMRYRTDGGFSHTEDGKLSEGATAQAFLALSSYIKFTSGGGSVFISDKARPDEVLPYEEETVPDSDEDTADEEGLDYRIPVCIAIALIGAILAIILFIKGKRNPKSYITLVCVCALLILITLLTKISSADDYYNGEGIKKDNPIGTVTLTVLCDKVPGIEEHSSLPKDGVILKKCEFEIEDGDSAYSILTEAARKYGIMLDTSGSGASVYVRGINNLYEYDYGELSGWLYYVNGERPSSGMGTYILSDGDDIVIRYTLQMGRD